MGVLVADTEGTIDKSVSRILVSDTEGNSDKEIQNGYVADTQGDIDKQFYANWKYYTGTILNSSAEKRNISTVATLTPTAKSYFIKPKHIVTSAEVCTNCVVGDEYMYFRLKVEYLNESGNWVVLKESSSGTTVRCSYKTLTLDFDVTNEIMTKQLRYTLFRTGGDTSGFYNLFYGKCTAWWQKG